MEERNLQAIDGATLMGLYLEPTRFCVDTLLPQGVCFLGGASKIGTVSYTHLDVYKRQSHRKPRFPNAAAHCTASLGWMCRSRYWRQPRAAASR